MNLIRTVVINVIVFLILLVLLEISAGVVRAFLGKDFKLPSLHLSMNPDDPSHPCAEMKTDVLLSHVPNNERLCSPLGGKVSGEYVIYDSSSIENPVILTLGGSTTSGWYQHLSDGETFPKALAEYAKDNYYVLNGGVGGYSSLQELYKFLRDGAKIQNLKLVVSLNGINDIPGYHGQNLLDSSLNPFLTQIQQSMNKNQIWIDQRVSNARLKMLFPNFASLLVYFSYAIEDRVANARATPVKAVAANESIFKGLDAATRWEINAQRMHELVELNGADYFLFLQPTLGLDGPQSKAPTGSNDAKLLAELDNVYIKELRDFYGEVKERCKRLPYCYDISNEVPPTGDVYNDARHHNAKGNKILANKIWSILERYSG